MLQQTTGDVHLADHKRRHQRAGVAVLTAIPTNSRRIPSRTALNIASAGYGRYCLLTNRGSSGECRLNRRDRHAYPAAPETGGKQMANKATVLIAGAALVGLAAAALAGPERISFPADYKTTFTQYHSGERLNGEQYAMIYANDIALQTARDGGAMPDGAQIVMEVYKPKMDAGGEPVRDAEGSLMPGDLAAIAVMETQHGWGAAYPDDIRSGDWDFGMFDTAGAIKNPESTACLECHAPYGDSAYMHTYSQLVSKAAE
jgi:hypothetical protein